MSCEEELTLTDNKKGNGTTGPSFQNGWNPAFVEGKESLVSDNLGNARNKMTITMDFEH
jgi:hypothetical protein